MNIGAQVGLFNTDPLSFRAYPVVSAGMPCYFTPLVHVLGFPLLQYDYLVLPKSILPDCSNIVTLPIPG